MVSAMYTPTDKRLPTELARIQRSVRDVQRPTGTERERSLLRLEEAMLELAAQQAQLASQQAQLEAVVAALPVAFAGENVGGGFTPSTSWQTVATLTIPRPAGKTKASVMALASTVINWSVAGSAAWPVVSARVLVNGSAGPAVPLGQGVSAAASSVSGRASGAAMRASSADGSGNVTVLLQVAITAWIGDGPQGQVSWSGGSPQVAANVVFSS